MLDMFNTAPSYLHDVFVLRFDGWVILGFVAQGFFTMRFVVQWIASERARRSVIPVAFWFFSIGGGVLLLIYALYRRDPVFIAGQALGCWFTSATCISSSSTGGRRLAERLSIIGKDGLPAPRAQSARFRHSDAREIRRLRRARDKPPNRCENEFA